MKTINDLTKYFGYYKSNEEFQNMLSQILINPSRYNSQSLYQTCKKTKLEIGFTNERMIREADSEKPIMGGRPIFTHFNIFEKSANLFERLPFGIVFSDKREKVREKAGPPVSIIDCNTPVLGWTKSDHYEIDNIKICFDYNPDDDSIHFIQVIQREEKINEETKLK